MAYRPHRRRDRGRPPGAGRVRFPVWLSEGIGAGTGEYILYATGSSARQTRMTDKRPCDAVIMAIVDNWEVGGEIKYHKGESERQRQ